MPGYSVIDKTYGAIGIIEKILDFPQQAIFQIKYGEHEILIPARDEFIIGVDRLKKQIELDAPQGLIDIYINQKEENNSDEENE